MQINAYRGVAGKGVKEFSRERGYSVEGVAFGANDERGRERFVRATGHDRRRWQPPLDSVARQNAVPSAQWWATRKLYALGWKN